MLAFAAATNRVAVFCGELFLVLALDCLGRPRLGVAKQPADRLTPSHGQRFALGGVAFELLASGSGPSSGFMIEPDAARYCSPADRHPVVADLLCSVAIDDALFEGASPYGALELPSGAISDLAHGELELRAPRARAVLCRIGPQRYACSARVARDPMALSTLLRSLVAIVVHDVGGLIMHAAGIVLDEQAVLYVGPSGAGKSTAATLTEGASMFAADHVAVIPQRDGGVLAYGLPGGNAAAMTHTAQAVWPLAAVFRILRDAHEAAVPHVPRARVLQGAQSLFVLREAVESADVSTGAEQARLSAVTEIAPALTVGTLHTVLGAPLGALVRGQLASRGAQA